VRFLGGAWLLRVVVEWTDNPLTKIDEVNTLQHY